MKIMVEGQERGLLHRQQKKKEGNLDQKQTLGGLMLDYELWIEAGNQLGGGTEFNILSKLALGIRFIQLLGLLLVLMSLYGVRANGVVPGDGLYEERMKIEGEENQWNGEVGRGNEKPLEQDIVKGEPNAVVV